MKIKAFPFLIAILFAAAHVMLADILYFYGTVIHPQASHKMLNLIATAMLLPFSPLMFVPKVGAAYPLVPALIFGFWIWAYYKLLSKRLPLCGKLCDQFCRS